MDRQSLLQNGARPHEGSFLESPARDKSLDGRRLVENRVKEPSWNRRETATESVARNAEQQISNSDMRFLPWRSLPAQRSTMTIAEFVERKFLPERVAQMRYAGRTHYQAMLKHVLTPEEVNRVFQSGDGRSKGKLHAIPDWPYLDQVLLCEAGPENIERLTIAASKSGYSSQTVAHIRNVVGAVFSHAIREQCFVGENPVSQVRLSKEASQKTGSLSFAQAKQVIGAMRSPEKEMTLFAISTDMNMAEICGLKWKHVNLSGEERSVDGESIPPRSIAVRKQWYRGSLAAVSPGRVRNLPISDCLLLLLMKLRNRARFTGPDDFVLVSRLGTPVNQTNIAERRLKPIAEQFNLPSLSWQIFRRTRKTLASGAGISLDSLVTMAMTPVLPADPGEHRIWHCRNHLSRV